MFGAHFLFPGKKYLDREQNLKIAILLNPPEEWDIYTFLES